MFGMAGETEFDLRFQLFGIPVRVHPLFWVLAAFIPWRLARGQLNFVFVGALCVFVSVMVHEFGHAVTFRRYGYRGEVVLYMMGGYATGGHLSTWRRIFVCAAGPGAGFALYGVVRAFQEWAPLDWRLNAYVDFAVVMLGFMNFWLSVLNLTPCLPLDGGQIMDALVFRYWPRKAAVKVLWISILSSGAIALWAASRQDRFLLILFGILCAQHVIALNNHRSFR